MRNNSEGTFVSNVGVTGGVDTAVSVGSDGVAGGEGFADFGVDERVLRALEKRGYTVPSPIQCATIPVLLSGRDVVGLAQTGTGKTAAFAVPALSALAGSVGRGVQVLVLTPTRELALQVSEAFVSYAAFLPKVNVLSIYGGQSYAPQLQALRRGVQVVVGTPGRVIDHLERGSLDLSQLQYLVLDEADEMLRMGFQQDVEQILAKTRPEKQVALFSATMPASIRRIAGKYLRDPKEVTVVSKTTTGANIKQSFLQVAHGFKFDVLTRLLEAGSYGGVICFVRTKQSTEDLADKLKLAGFRAAAINGDIAQQQRERTIEGLRDSKIDVLVATDVAARGLDVPRIGLVVNYDAPHDTESYVHRIGRTGRAGRLGEAVLFVTARERRLVRSIENATRQSLEALVLPSVEDINRLRLEKFASKVVGVLEKQDLRVFKSFVSEFETVRGFAGVDVAAALAFLAQGGRSLLLGELPDFSGEGQGRSARVRRGGSDVGKVTYRIAVGREQKVLPGAIVGAIANEGGIASADIGQIDIRSDHSLVDLPKDLSEGVWRALRKTRIGGRLINLEVSKGGVRVGGQSSRSRGGRSRSRGEVGKFGEGGGRKRVSRGVGAR